MACSSRSALYTLHSLARSLPSAAPTSAALSCASSLASSSSSSPRPYSRRPAVGHVQQVRHASFSGSFLRNLIPRRRPKRDADDASAAAETTPAAVADKQEQEAPKGLFDTVTEDEDVLLTQQRSGLVARPPKPATFHKSSTANFKTSRRKLNDLARLIAGRTADEAILQLQASEKKQAPRLLSMVALARDHAMAKGLKREELVVAQSWVTKGQYLQRIDIKGRGRFGVKHHPSAKLHVLLAEGLTNEERRRQRKQDQWRRSIRGLTEGDGVGVGRGAKPIINAGVGGWRSAKVRFVTYVFLPAKLVSAIKANYTDKYAESNRHWDGGLRGKKSIAKLEARAKALGKDKSTVSHHV
ncbi:hypothetical protein JCM10908_004903 [Rhodotorula pacifica]|uniref:uL22m family ribosomal protein n=1 Tax=Rhodotorula pacifica TaxID=1495444 RepID=UPI003177221F